MKDSGLRKMLLLCALKTFCSKTIADVACSLLLSLIPHIERVALAVGVTPFISTAALLFPVPL
jgi:hypothetical protein